VSEVAVVYSCAAFASEVGGGVHEWSVIGPDLIKQIWFCISNIQCYPNNSCCRPDTGVHAPRTRGVDRSQ